MYAPATCGRRRRRFILTHEQQEAFAQDPPAADFALGEVTAVITGMQADWPVVPQPEGRSVPESGDDGRATILRRTFSGCAFTDEYLQAGYPIASGVIEGGPVGTSSRDRMEQGGMRWTLEGAKAMLNVRSVLASTELEKFNSLARSAEEAKRSRCVRTGT